MDINEKWYIFDHCHQSPWWHHMRIYLHQESLLFTASAAFFLGKSVVVVDRMERSWLGCSSPKEWIQQRKWSGCYEGIYRSYQKRDRVQFYPWVVEALPGGLIKYKPNECGSQWGCNLWETSSNWSGCLRFGIPTGGFPCSGRQCRFGCLCGSSVSIGYDVEKRDESDGDQRHKLHDKRDGVWILLK